MNVDEGMALRPQRSFPEPRWSGRKKIGRDSGGDLNALEAFPGAREAVVASLIQHYRGAEKEEYGE